MPFDMQQAYEMPLYKHYVTAFRDQTSASSLYKTGTFSAVPSHF